MAGIRNPVSILQEFCVAQFRRLPDYTFQQVDEQLYRCTVNVCEIVVDATGLGKKVSKSKAAEAMLLELGLSDAIYEEKAGTAPVTSSLPLSSSVSSSTQSSCFPSSSTCSDYPVAAERTVGSKCTYGLSLVGDTSKTRGDGKSLPEMKMTHMLVEQAFTSKSSVNIGNTSSKNCDTPMKVLESSSNETDSTVGRSTRPFAHNLTRKLLVVSTASEVFTSTPSQILTEDRTSRVAEEPPKRFKSQPEAVNAVSSTFVGDEADGRDTEGCLKSPVSFLQEEARRRGLSSPRYTLELTDDSSGSRVFYMEVSVDGRTAMGSGPSKREAKANAALSIMSIMSIPYHQRLPSDSKPHNPADVNYVGKLHTYCLNSLVGLSPEYCCVESQGQAHSKVFTMKCTVGATERTGTGSTKKEAKHASALATLQALKEECQGGRRLCSVEADAPQRKRLDDPVDNSNAWHEFHRVRGLDRPYLETDLGRIPINDYIGLFSNGFYGESPTLNAVRSSSSPLASGHRETFHKIMEELSINYKLHRMETTAPIIVLNLVMETSPTWSFMQVAETMEEARHNIYKEAVDFLVAM